MTVLDVRTRVHLRLNRLRTIERLVNLPDFHKVLEKYGYQKIMELISDINADELKKLVKDIDKPLEEWSYRDLRDRAKWLNVDHWSRLTKEELIIQINLVT